MEAAENADGIIVCTDCDEFKVRQETYPFRLSIQPYSPTWRLSYAPE